MKKVLAIVLFLAISLPVPAIAANMIENGGFEYEMFGWTILDELGNTLEVRPNSQTGIAIEGANALYVGIWNAQPLNSWRTSIKYQLPVILETGEYILQFTVAKLSDNGQVSAGIQDNRPPYTSLFWTNVIDLKYVGKNTAQTYRYEFSIGQAVMYPAVVLNFAGAQQEIIVDNVIIQKKSEYYYGMTTVSGSISHVYRRMPAGLHVMLYPDGDFYNEEAVVVPVASNGTWQATVQSGRSYTAEVYVKSGTIIYKWFTAPWLWRINATDGGVSGVNFHLYCRRLFNYKTPFTLDAECKP